MKKLVAVSLMGILALFTGCGETAVTTPPAATPTPAPMTPAEPTAPSPTTTTPGTTPSPTPTPSPAPTPAPSPAPAPTPTPTPAPLPAPNPPPMTTNVINMEVGNFFFKPAALKLKVNQPVKINFANAGSHTFTIDELGVNQSLSGSSGSVSFTPTKKGTFQFYCVPHKGVGMVGTVTVE